MDTTAPLLTITSEHHLFDTILPTLLSEAAAWGGVSVTVTAHDYDREWTGTIYKFVPYNEHETYLYLTVGAREESFELRQIKTLHIH